MALSTGLHLRQGQSLVMTPQLLQAIKLLQLSSLELSAYVEAELERNPLLERHEEEDSPIAGSDASLPDDSGPVSGDWAGDELATNATELATSLDTDITNSFTEDGAGVGPRVAATERDGLTLSEPLWGGNGQGGSFEADDEASFEDFATVKPNLHEHLAEQLALSVHDPVDRMIGRMLIDGIDEAGYLRESVAEVAERLSTVPERVEAVLTRIQGFDPSGVGGRDLAECLAIQLRERDRLDPAMQAMLSRLDLVAKRDFTGLQKLCGVDGEDIAEMLREIRALDPKPGRAFGGDVSSPVVPDVFVRPAVDGSWIIELNNSALPRVLVNQAYYARVSKTAKQESEKSFIQDCYQTASWLTRSLDQRAKTILKVASEIVRQQDGFFLNGVAHLRPLNLRMVADMIGMHESTISRVTSNKFMATHRGLFEMKYFFSASIAATRGGEAHSAEAVRHLIKQLIDSEAPSNILSDDAIVAELKGSGIDIARRTVAKYRESLRIPSSVERKREKMA